jgi:hypothetical protein
VPTARANNVPACKGKHGGYYGIIGDLLSRGFLTCQGLFLSRQKRQLTPLLFLWKINLKQNFATPAVIFTGAGRS